MDFCFFRAGKPNIAVGTVALLTGLVLMPFASAQSQAPAAGQQPAGGQQPAAGQQPGAAATQKNWKDRAEYDLYVKMSQTQDPKARLDLLNNWSDKYPQTDYNQERLVYYVNTLAQLAPTDPTARQQLLQKAQDLLKLDPSNFQAMYFTALWGPAVGGASPSPDVAGQVETAANGVLSNIDKAFDPSKKPASVSEADFTKAKGQAQAVAHNALAWVDSSKKDTAGAEEQYKDSLQTNPDQGNISALYAKLLYDDKKFPEALFEYARAAEYAGPGPSLPAATRQQLTDFFNKAYKDFHGSAEGADQVLSQAKTNALPPSGYNVTSQADLANKEASELQNRINSDPSFKLWYSVQQGLTGSGGDQFFTSNVKDAELPGGAEGVKNFSGTVISIDPPDRPTKVVLGVQSPTTPDATLAFSQPLPASALDKIKVGQKLDFSGVAESYTANPYMLTFKDPSIPGVQTAAPPRTGTHRPRHR